MGTAFGSNESTKTEEPDAGKITLRGKTTETYKVVRDVTIWLQEVKKA